MLQVRVDEKLKQQASDIYEAMGIDLSTAVRMFLTKSVEVQGIPFKVAAVAPEDYVTTKLPKAAAKKPAPKAEPKAEAIPKKIVVKESDFPKPATFRNTDMSWD